MAVDKLVDSTQLDANLTSVANAIRTKGGTSASLAFPADFVSAIGAIPTGGGGGSMVSGSFTPVENLSEIDLEDLGAESLTHFLLKMTAAALPEATGARTNVLIYADFTADTYATIYSNTSGTSINYNGFGEITSSSMIKRSGDTVVISTAGQLVAGITYEWYAW